MIFSEPKPPNLVPELINSTNRIHVLVFLTLTALFCGHSHAADRKPSIVVVVADDYGVEGLSADGGISHQTPNIDRLAKEGMRFTRCFSNLSGSPSRGSLLTGRYPVQNGLKIVLSSKNQENIYLHRSQPGFPRQLRQHGSATQIVGKWHVALDNKHNTIREFGFAHSQTGQVFGGQCQKTARFWNPCLMPDGRGIADETKDRCGPDVDLEAYLDFIKASVKQNEPILAYCSTFRPYYLWEPAPDRNEKIHLAPNTAHKAASKIFL